VAGLPGGSLLTDSPFYRLSSDSHIKASRKGDHVNDSNNVNTPTSTEPADVDDLTEAGTTNGSSVPTGTDNTTVVPDRDQIIAFLKAIYPVYPEGITGLTAFTVTGRSFNLGNRLGEWPDRNVTQDHAWLADKIVRISAGIAPTPKESKEYFPYVPVTGVFMRLPTTMGDWPIGNQRGGQGNVCELVGFVLDGDYEVPGHHERSKKDTGKLPLPKSAEEVQQIWAEAIGSAPTLVWNSGGGINGAWLLDRPIRITDDEAGTLLVKEWRAASGRFHDRIVRTAKGKGRHHDSVPNNDRLMRIAGTVNAKKNAVAKTSQIVTTNGPRYSLDDLLALAPEPILQEDNSLVDAVTGEVIRDARPSYTGTASAGSATGFSHGDGESPGNHYDREVWEQGRFLSLLHAAGWADEKYHGASLYLWRPGKGPGEQTSATLGSNDSVGALSHGAKFYNFSDNAPGLLGVDKNEIVPLSNGRETKGFKGRFLSPYAFLCATQYGGDWSACGSALAAQGYGSNHSGSYQAEEETSMWEVEQMDDSGNIVAIPQQATHPAAPATDDLDPVLVRTAKLLAVPKDQAIVRITALAEEIAACAPDDIREILVRCTDIASRLDLYEISKGQDRYPNFYVYTPFLAAAEGKGLTEDQIIEVIAPVFQAARADTDLIEKKPAYKALLDDEKRRYFGDSARRIVLRKASTIKPKPVYWLWDTTPDELKRSAPTSHGRIPMHSFVISAGPPGHGKSQQACWMAARITTGTLPGELEGQPRAVIYCATEDSWEHTIIPRLIAAGADLELVYYMEAQDTNGDASSWKLTLPVDTAVVGALAEEAKAALLILDPLLSHIDRSVNDYKAADVRQALEPLIAAASKHHFTILGLAHFTKNKSDSDPLNRIAGSGAFGQLVRAALVFAKDDGEADGDEQRFVMSLAKNNLGRENLPSHQYTIVSATVPTEEGPAHVSKFVLGPETNNSVQQVMEDAASGGFDREERSEAEAWLYDYLTSMENGGEATPDDIRKSATKAGVTPNALTQAKKKLKVKSVKSGGSGSPWVWQLPNFSGTSLKKWAQNPGGDN
jgi:hypothetical protein